MATNSADRLSGYARQCEHHEPDMFLRGSPSASLAERPTVSAAGADEQADHAGDVFLRTRKSSLLFGVGQDAAVVARTITHG